MASEPDRRWETYGRARPLALELRDRGHGAGLPFALVGSAGRVELSQRDLEWLLAVGPRALASSRRET